MDQPIGIRLPKDLLRKVDSLGKEQLEDRSSMIRKLLMTGYREVMKQNAAQAYMQGKVTLSMASHKAGLTLWEMESYLIQQGFVSSYSVEDIEKEVREMQRKKR